MLNEIGEFHNDNYVFPLMWDLEVGSTLGIQKGSCRGISLKEHDVHVWRHHGEPFHLYNYCVS